MIKTKVDTRKTVEVCFSPRLFPHIITQNNYISVVVDILRASTSICAAFENKVKKIIPVSYINKAKKYKEKGYLVASERDGKILDFADFGNSPFNFLKEEVKGKVIAYRTTNGTQAIKIAAKKSDKLVIGSFINLEALSNWLIEQNKNVVILCAGWKNKFNLEDSIFAGALAEKILNNPNFKTSCDSAVAAIDLWNISKTNLLSYIEKASHRHRLKKMVLDDVLQYCFTPDSSKIIPILDGDGIINISDLSE